MDLDDVDDLDDRDDVDDLDDVVRRTIGGDLSARERLRHLANARREAVAVVVTAVLDDDPVLLTVAGRLATTSRDRQVVAIATAHVSGDDDLARALARDHLVDYPDSLVVAWLVGR